MDADEYKKRSREIIEYIDNYLNGIRGRYVFPRVEPGYLRSLCDTQAPSQPEAWSAIFTDIESVIMPGTTQWQSPHMHAYFPALNSYPSLLGDMLANAINSLGFSWASNPAGTELETLVMDWLAGMIGLPDKFRFDRTKTHGGGIILTTLSEATFTSILTARKIAITRYRETTGDKDTPPAIINAKLVAYCSDQAHSSVEKACIIAFIELRCLSSNPGDFSVCGETLEAAIAEDTKAGKIPFYLCATLGTTGCCAFDNLAELGPICARSNIWCHVDAAYAGTSFVCPEFRHFMKGIEYVRSFAFNPSKWMMVHFDCTAFWIENSYLLHDVFINNPVYAEDDDESQAIDYHFWQLPQSKRFRALKLWFVIRSYGIEGLQEHVRSGVKRAQHFEQLVRDDDRFEIAAPRHLGLVSFRLKGENVLTERLLKRINKQGHMHCVPASLKGTYIIRFTVTSPRTTPEDIVRDWSLIKEHAVAILALDNEAKTKEYNTENLSLLLSNVPKIAKFMNSSYAAFLEDEDWQDTYKRVRLTRTASGRYRPNKIAPFSTEHIPSPSSPCRQRRDFLDRRGSGRRERSNSLQIPSPEDVPIISNDILKPIP